MTNFTSYELPELPYELNALEPVISKEIMDIHYNKHHSAYVKNLNAAMEKFMEAESNENIQVMTALLGAINFNGGGHINHTIFWTNLAPEGKGGGGAPSGHLATAINNEFGSFQNFVDQFTNKTNMIQGSGWGWLGYSKEKQNIEIVTCPNQDSLSSKGLIPLLGVDVWEHAYYLQYKNVRLDYLKNIWRIINWKNVAERFEKAK